jgi:2-methylcitrate dehydratase PrpD
MTPSGVDVTEQLVAAALGFSTSDLPATAVWSVKLSVLDLVGCCVAGSNDEGARLVGSWASEASVGDAVILGTSRRASPAMAALANGTSGHALDFDDVSVRMIHPSSSIVPVLLAAAASHRVSGAALLDGYLSGFEVQARLCRELNPDHYARGWHTTGTIGTLGASVAACAVLGVDVEVARQALGIAASSAAGIRRNFGSMVKSLHAGHAAFHGLQSAELAARGFTADRSVLEGPSGFLGVFSDLERVVDLTAAFAPGAPFELVESGIALKRFACCGAIHSAQDAILELQASHGFGPDDVRRIECRVNPMVPNILVHHVTREGLEGKFSMEYSVAVCLADGRASLPQYADERAKDPSLQDLMRRIDVVVDESIPVNLAYFPTAVTVELADGRTASTRVDIPRGYPERPLTVDEVVEKARTCCTPSIADSQFTELVEMVLHLEELDDVRRLTALLVPSGQGR